MLWYIGMGHPFVKVLKHLSLINKEASASICDTCSICTMAKQTRLPFIVTKSRNSEIFFYLIHLDVRGPYRIPTHHDFRFFLTIMDDN